MIRGRAVGAFLHAAATVPARWNTYRPIFTEFSENKYEGAVWANGFANSWLSAANIKFKDIDKKAIGPFSHYVRFVAAVDSELDRRGAQSVGNILKSEKVRQIRRDFFESAKQMDERRQQQLKRTFTESSKRMIAAVKEREGGLKGFDESVAFRIKTSGEMSRAMAAVMNVAHDIPKKDAEKIERAFENMGMALQVDDDLYDLAQDRNERTKENVIYQMLRHNPDELEKVGKALEKSPKMNFNRFNKIAPRTAMQAACLQRKYLDAIGGDKELEYMRNFAEFFELR